MAANPNAVETHSPLPSQLAPQDRGTSATQRQDQAIHDLLQRGTDPDHIPQYVETHRSIWSTGNGHDLAIIADIPTDELPARIHNVMNSSRPSFVNARPYPNRRPSDEEQERPLECAHIPSNGKEKAPVTADNDKPAKKAKIYGCPGNAGKCQEHKNRQWRSKIEFWTHFETHLPEYAFLDGYQCLECVKRKPSWNAASTATETYSQGRELAIHIWSRHMVSFTTS